MVHTVNPYDHLPAKELERQIKRITRKLTKYALKKKPSSNFEHQRVVLLSLSDALQRRKEKDWMEALHSAPSANPTEISIVE